MIKKKLLLTVLSVASATAFADVNLYGRLAVGYENDNYQNSTAPQANSVQDFGSYFGIRGSDPVYGETSAIWQVESLLDLASGQAYAATTGGGMIVPNPNGGASHVNGEFNVFASSESYLGLQGGWGRVRVGNLSNYMRSSMAAVDLYNSANGQNGFGIYSRTTKLIPTAFRYDSPTWGGFSFAAVYGFNNSGYGASGVAGGGSTFDSGAGLGGVYSGGVYSLGLGWSNYNWSVNLGTMLWQQVGNYQTNSSGLTNNVSPGTGSIYPNSTYSNAYVGRLEVGYQDPDGLIFGAGFQIANGLGWSSWANSGGSLGFIYNPGTNITGLNSNQLQTQEAGLSVGWHLGPWTPKIGYMYGNNMMYGGNVGDIISGSARQIADSGYQIAVAELDWNITPRTIVFMNYGQAWFGSTLQNISFSCPSSSSGSAPGTCTPSQSTVNGANAYENNESSFAIGFSNTF